MNAGNIIFLNGTSSAGKSALAKALQDAMDEPYVHTGIDHWLERVPHKYFVYSDGVTPATADGWLLVFRDGALVELPRIGHVGYRLLAGMYAAIAALAAQGNHVIVDDVIYDPRVLRLAVDALHDARLWFVGVRCAVVVAEQRERERGDRAPGGARIFEGSVHAHGIYDLEVDTTSAMLTECARQIQRGMSELPTPSAFKRLHQLR